MKKRKPGWPRGLSAKTRKELMRLARRDYTPEEHLAIGLLGLVRRMVDRKCDCTDEEKALGHEVGCRLWIAPAPSTEKPS